MWILLALIAVPMIEIALFIQVGGLLGLWPTLAIVILTAVLGTVLLRMQGFAALADVQTKLKAGDDPSSALAHGAMILIAGIVLLTPGFFTDAIGFLLLIPPVRAAVIRNVGARVKVHAAATMSRQHAAGGAPRPEMGGATIDGDYQDVTPPTEQEVPGNSGWTKGDPGVGKNG